jgi:SAM-dependent methyltransferase
MQKTDADLSAHYLQYELFDNDPRADKIVRSAGKPDRTRGQFAADLLLEHLGPRPNARVLEIGCHRGAFLSALRSRGPDLQLEGCDLDPSYARWIEPVCGPGNYHHEGLDRLAGPFDACVLIHTLEHIPQPLETLHTVRRLLAPDGMLLIVVPDVLANPFDVLVIDHTCHFDADQLRGTLRRAGFTGTVDPDLITNELVAVARPAGEAVALPERPAPWPADGFRSLRRFERGLANLPAGDYHILGTAVVGVLVAGILGDRCIGFVDEAPFRIGQTFLGRTVRAPQALAAGEPVILGVAERLAGPVTVRLTGLGLRVINPWELSPDAD